MKLTRTATHHLLVFGLTLLGSLLPSRHAWAQG
ncbi:MAG: hypothetical protein K0Q72_4682 [Armatimonadetes bacterium]|jgi:hypothetical protein|nr:hypothetical protein [Armatimonadota bacterium]